MHSRRLSYSSMKSLLVIIITLLVCTLLVYCTLVCCTVFCLLVIVTDLKPMTQLVVQNMEYFLYYIILIFDDNCQK